MSIIEYAMQMEADGETYYRQAARQVDRNCLKVILLMLADDEVRHFKALEQMKNDCPPELSESTIMSDTRNIFVRMRKENSSDENAQDQTYQQLQAIDVRQIQLYREGLEIEQKSMDFYELNANQTENEDHRNLFLKLAGEEKKHYFLLENVIEFISRPGNWLENAEFVHLEE